MCTYDSSMSKSGYNDTPVAVRVAIRRRVLTLHLANLCGHYQNCYGLTLMVNWSLLTQAASAKTFLVPDVKGTEVEAE